jgi:tetratricopeptide (TPR) repeat protein
MAIGAVAAQFVFLSAAAVVALHGQRDAPNFKTEQARLHYEKGLAYGDKGLWAPAIIELNRAKALEPGNAEILIELGIAHGERKNWKQAGIALRKAAAIAPASAQAHYNLALTLDRADPGKGAGTAEYRKVLRLNPQHVQALINLAIDVGDHDAAEARRLLERAIRLDAKDANAHLNLGLLLKREAQASASVPEFRRAIELDPNLLEARRQLAELLSAGNQWGGVIAECREILKREPDDASARYTLGQALIRSGKTEDGRKELERAQSLRQRAQQRQEAQQFQVEGLRKLNAGNPADAVKAFTAAVERDGSSINRMYLGLALGVLGDMKAGIRNLTAAIELEPSNAQAHVNLGTLYLQSGQDYLAQSEFEKALQSNPWLPEAHNNLGLVLSKGNQAGQALEHFRLAADLNPQYLDAVFNLGLCERAMGGLENALAAFQRAAALDPNNARVQYALGLTLKDKGDAAGGQAAMDRAARLERQSK